MAHFAKVNSQGIVEQVIVAEQDVINSGLFGNPTGWVQTSYNTRGGVHSLGGTPLRKNYAGIGFTYDIIRDAFIPPKPFSSWLLNPDTCLWEPPVPYPNDGNPYNWDEGTLSWVGIAPIVETAPEVVESIVLTSAEPTISLDLGSASATVAASATPTI